MLDSPIDLPTNSRAVIATHVQFLTRNICHTKHFSDSPEKRDAPQEERETSREKRDSSSKKRDEVVTYF